MSKRTLSFLSSFLLSVTCLMTLSFNIFGSISEPKTWQLAPPSPSFSDAERQSELSKRRQQVMNRMNEKSLMVLFSAEPKLYTNDVDYPYRQENNLYYLTGIKQQDTKLILVPGAKTMQAILFISKIDARRTTWNGKMLTIEEARKISGIQEVWDLDQFNQFMLFLSPRAGYALANGGAPRGRGAAPKFDEKWLPEFATIREAINKDQGELFLLLPGGLNSVEYKQEQEFTQKIAPISSGFALKSAMSIFAELRQIKSTYEVRLMQQAVDISIEGFNRAFAVAAPKVFEYEVQAEFEYTYRKRNADSWGYPCIVGGGDNATTLHYETSQDQLPDNGLLLMDCAAEFDHYSADITRTIPLSGKYSPAQAEIYRIVYEAQEAGIKAARAGKTKTDSHNEATKVIKEGLLKLGLITSKDNDEYRIWFMHGTSHWLGMNVHDVGNTDKLSAGMIYTVEPGIYVRADALDNLPKTPENEKFIAAVKPAYEKYKGIGVRIEDDVLVTDGEPKVLSGTLPRKLEDVEAFIAQLKSRVLKNGLP